MPPTAPFVESTPRHNPFLGYARDKIAAEETLRRAYDERGFPVTLVRQLLGYARQWPDRLWAVEGANGAGRPLAARLQAAGETVVDVPATLAALDSAAPARRPGAAGSESPAETPSARRPAGR